MRSLGLIACLAASAGAACHRHADTTTESTPAASGSASPGNPVQQEMRALTAALQEAVLGVGMADVRGVEHALHRVHAAKAVTESALQTGSYRPSKNADRLQRFRELDEQFHAVLEQLVETSRRNDIAGTADALGAALRSCPGCHAEFRVDPPR